VRRLSHIKVFALKEAKEVVRDRFLLFNLVISPFLAAVITIVVIETFVLAAPSDAGEGPVLVKAAVVDLDGGFVASYLSLVLGLGVAESVEGALSQGYTVVYVVPEGFAESLEKGQASIRVIIDIEGVLSEAGLRGALGVLAVNSLVLEYVEAAAYSLLGVEGAGGRPGSLVAPQIVLEGDYNVGLGAVVIAPLLLAFIALISITVLLQAAALSIGYEREQRTLELMLSTPLSRWGYIVSKVAGIAVMASIGLASTVAAEAVVFGYIYSRLASGIADGSVGLLGSLDFSGIASPWSVAVIALSTVATVVYAAGIGLLLGVLASGDAKSAQTASGMAVILVLLTIFPYAVIPLKVLHALLASVHPVAAGPVAYYLYAAQGPLHAMAVVAAELALAVAMLALSVKLASPENLLSPPGAALSRIFRVRGAAAEE
jgi:ABC-2 type transport system permease protein